MPVVSKNGSENTPLVSVVTPTYNQAAFLRETIDTVLSQDYPNIELIVIDDGSTDETPQILAEYTGRIQWESQKNMGQLPPLIKGGNSQKAKLLPGYTQMTPFFPAR